MCACLTHLSDNQPAKLPVPRPPAYFEPSASSTRSFNAATGPLGSEYIDQFGSSDWLLARSIEAITGNGAFTASTDAERAANLRALLTIELPIIRALVAVEAGERNTDAGDLDRRFGAPHDWDRTWAILFGAPAIATTLGDALNNELLIAIVTGAAAAETGDNETGDNETAATAHDTVQIALVRTALEAIANAEAQTDRTTARAYLHAIQPHLARLDPQATQRLAALLDPTTPPDPEALHTVILSLAARANLDPSLVATES